MLVWGGYSVVGPVPGGGLYNPVTDTWRPMATTGQPTWLFDSTAVWTGSEMIVWGGEQTNVGARYRLATDTWLPVSTVEAPAPRNVHTAVWTGTRMIIWGGYTVDPDTGLPADLDTGGSYDPVGDSWSPTRTNGAPSPRENHSAVWDGTYMIVWGGSSYDPVTGTGTLYDNGKLYWPAQDRWVNMSQMGAPSPRENHSAVWTGTEMIVWGGADNSGALSNGGRYDPASNQWSPMNSSGAPGGGTSYGFVWTGAEMILWGGFVNGDAGGRYDPVLDQWTPTRRTSDRPGARSQHASVWTGSEMIVTGGLLEPLLPVPPTEIESWRYDPATDAWSPTSVSDALVDRVDHSAVWTGTELIVWGGVAYDNPLPPIGLRYSPLTDVWSPTNTTGEATPRRFHTAVWTGRYMVVWGGLTTGSPTNTGGRYDPSLDAWSPMSVDGAPLPRDRHSAVWTGREMIVSGGHIYDNSGGRYDPERDSWSTMQPLPGPERCNLRGVWTGQKMIVWGGDDCFTLFHCCPRTPA